MDEAIKNHFNKIILENPRRVMKEDGEIVEVYSQPERSKREDHESGCGALNSMET